MAKRIISGLSNHWRLIASVVMALVWLVSTIMLIEGPMLWKALLALAAGGFLILGITKPEDVE